MQSERQRLHNYHGKKRIKQCQRITLHVQDKDKLLCLRLFRLTSW